MSFTISSRAAKKAIQLMEKEGKSGHILRIGVQGGGCSGFSYVLKFEEKVNDNDHIVELDGLTAACDAKSMKYLEGIEIDYETNLLKAGFKFINPTAKKSCSCGESFSV